MLTVLLPLLATIRSGRPLLLTSATATAAGWVPTAKFWAAANVPLSLPSSTLTVLLPELAVTRSASPSPFTSATATASGFTPVGSVTPGANRLGRVRASKTSSRGREGRAEPRGELRRDRRDQRAACMAATFRSHGASSPKRSGGKRGFSPR